MWPAGTKHKHRQFFFGENFDTETEVWPVFVTYICLVFFFGIQKFAAAQGENGFLMREKTSGFLGHQ